MNKTCAHCKEEFEVHSDDLKFFEKVSPRFNGKLFLIPPPTLCPSCRRIRRYAWRNERTLFQRTCDFSGEKLISSMSPDSPFPVYKNSIWWSDKHDGLKYGREVDFNRSMFDQIKELQRIVPHSHSFNTPEERQINSLYTNCVGDLKDCYLIFAASRNELCMYSTYIMDSFKCVDCFFCLHCTNCYESIDIERCNSLFYSENCKECYDSYWLYDCKSTGNSIGCVGLRQKQFHILNKQVSKEEFEKILKLIKQGNQETISFIEKGVKKLRESIPCKNIHADHNENCTGDYIWNSKNCRECYDTANAWDCAYCTWFVDGKDCMDVYSWGGAELCYEICSGGEEHYGCAFTVKSYGCKECFYTDLCIYSKNCFACVGLKNNQYCILNKQYTKEEYESLVPKVIELMRKHNEWGEFFPSINSPWGYHESVAMQYHPLNKQEAIAQGFSWSDYFSPSPKAKIISDTVLSAHISEVTEDVLNYAIQCKESGRVFKLVTSELDFYKSNSLPLPKLHHDLRHAKRVNKRNDRKLWKRFCEKCGVQMLSTYNPNGSEVVYCEGCYLEAAY